ncbi:hypothetical protein OV320_5110 [Actinobacteria bacterium OV320]|nr:hypothetical protein OV320_5110 [Actinobacteria bacterium OV320]
MAVREVGLAQRTPNHGNQSTAALRLNQGKETSMGYLANCGTALRARAGKGLLAATAGQVEVFPGRILM